MGGKACFKGLFMPKSLHKNRLRNPEMSMRDRIVMAANGPMHSVKEINVMEDVLVTP